MIPKADVNISPFDVQYIWNQFNTKFEMTDYNIIVNHIKCCTSDTEGKNSDLTLTRILSKVMDCFSKISFNAVAVGLLWVRNLQPFDLAHEAIHRYKKVAIKNMK